MVKKLSPRHFLFTTENPLYPNKDTIGMNAVDTTKVLRTMGEEAHTVAGMYGNPENSVLVNNPNNLELLHRIAYDAGQESGIYSDYGNHEYHYYHGENAGQMHKGQGTNWHDEAPEDFYTSMMTPDGPKRFTHNIDFDKLYPSDAAHASAPHPHGYDWHDSHSSHYAEDVQNESQSEDEPVEKAEGDESHPHMQAHGPIPQPSGNDQAGGNKSGKFHDIMGQWGTINEGTKTNLQHYKGMEAIEPQIDNHIGESGHQVYFAGGKYGKPDLANKNYNTKHLMVYDPTPQSGGDFGSEAYTRSWRKIHEKAHADTYESINAKYGEERRLGRLGPHLSLNAAQRAVMWEHLTVHRQRDLMADMGHHIPDETFNKEYNTVMGDAVLRVITGKFSDPSEMGFTPHSHKVPIETAMNLLEDHSKQLGLIDRHDSFIRRKKKNV